MSETIRVKLRYMVYAPDCMDVGVPQKRIALGGVHTARIQPMLADGTIETAGALLGSDGMPTPDVMPDFVGSVILIQAESLEAAKKIIEEDPYYMENVWDRERLIIAPMVSRA